VVRLGRRRSFRQIFTCCTFCSEWPKISKFFNVIAFKTMCSTHQEESWRKPGALEI